MYISLFALSLAYLSYNFYCVIRRIPPVFLEKRLHELRHDISIEDITTKRWDTPVGALSKFYACSILFTSFVVLTYLIGYENMVAYSLLYFAVLFGSGGVACLTDG